MYALLSSLERAYRARSSVVRVNEGAPYCGYDYYNPGV